MKYAVVFLSLLVLGSCSMQTGTERDIDYYEVHGKVNHLTIRHFYAADNNGTVVKGEPNYEEETDQTITFNEKGDILQAYFYGKNDSLDTKLVRDYDKGKCIAETRYDAFGNVLSEWVWLYDGKGQNTERVQILEDGTLFSSWRLHYNDEGYLIARISYSNPASGAFDSLYWVLDEKGRQVEEYNYGYYGYYGKNIVEYLGKTDFPNKAYVYNMYDDLTNILEMNYNDKDLVTRVSNFNADTVLVASVSFDYSYDEKGNWITKIQYYNDEPVNYEERRIIYY